jgi:tubulin--tyrosine ligase
MATVPRDPICCVLWPGAPLTHTLVVKALQALDVPLTILSSQAPHTPGSYLIQWSSYDLIDHELTHSHPRTTLASSYVFRKGLIRKHFLSRCLHSYVTKRPTSSLVAAVPKTFELEISFADELEEMWSDELYELGQALDSSNSWWILKPSVLLGDRLTPRVTQRLPTQGDGRSRHGDPPFQ